MNQNYNVPTLTCRRCGHKWIPKTNRKPKACPDPKCKSRVWDKPRQRKVPIVGFCKLCKKKVVLRRKRNYWGTLEPTWKTEGDSIFHEKCYKLHKKSVQKNYTYEYHTPPILGKVVIKQQD